MGGEEPYRRACLPDAEGTDRSDQRSPREMARDSRRVALRHEALARTMYPRAMGSPWPDDIYTEPDADPDTLANLGPLRPMAGVWGTDLRTDEHPVAEGSEQAK